MIDIESKRRYINTIKPYAQSIRYNLGIPVDKIMLHAAHESNWGMSGLCVMGHNHFGVTPGEKWESAMRGEMSMNNVPTWTTIDSGHAVETLPTTEFVKDFPPEKIRFFCFPGDIEEKRPDGKGGSILKVNRAFRKYADDGECFSDYAERLQNHMYANVLIVARTGSLEDFAHVLGAVGYGTDPDYAESMIKLIPSLRETMEGEATV